MADDAQAQEKEPTRWPEWFSAAMAQVREAAARYRKKPELPNAKEREQALHEAVARAGRVRGFLSSEFYKKDLEPFLREEAAKSQMRPWVPGDPVETHKLRAEFFFISGKAFAYLHPIEKIHEWLRSGNEAAKTLDYEKRAANSAAIDQRRVP